VDHLERRYYIYPGDCRQTWRFPASSQIPQQIESIDLTSHTWLVH
jgi:hypothetical protein